MFRIIIAALALAASLPVPAHEGAAHRNPDGPVRKEQKPWGIAGDAAAVRRTIAIAMSDAMRFTPDSIRIRQGEVVKFVVSNGGALLHEMVIGTKQELDQHAALMMKFPDMAHDEPYMAHVPAGRKAELIWKFNRPGEFDFACLVAGHYQAGMVGKITVTPR